MWCFRMIFYYFMRALTSAFGLAVINTVYLFAGAWIFYLIESPNESAILTNLQGDRRQLVSRLHQIVDPLLSAAVTEKYETTEISKALSFYEDSLATFYRKRTIVGKNKAANDSDSTKLWTHTGAVIYAYSVVTTIGWGNIVPTTRFGRMATIFYGFVGIPLVFTFSSEVGSFTTKIIRLLSYMTARIFCGASAEDKTMNRPLKKIDDPMINTAIRLETSAALNSGFNHYPQNGKSPPSLITDDGFLTWPVCMKPKIEGLNKNEALEDGANDFINNNSCYLRGLDSTMDFLLEISRDSNIWRGSEEKRGFEEGAIQGKKSLRQTSGEVDFLYYLSKARYRLSTTEDAELLSKQLGRLPLEDFCRIMTLVGFDFQREVLLRASKDSKESNSKLDLSHEKSNDHTQNPQQRSTQKKIGVQSERLSDDIRLIKSESEFEAVQVGNSDERIAEAVEAIDNVLTLASATITLQDENITAKKRKRKSSTNVGQDMKHEFYEKQEMAIKENGLNERLQIYGKRGGIFQPGNLHNLGGGESPCQGKHSNGFVLKERGEKYFSGSMMIGGGDDPILRSKVFPFINTDTTNHGGRSFTPNQLTSTRNIELDFSCEISPKLFRYDQDCLNKCTKYSRADNNQKEETKQNLLSIHQTNSLSATSYSVIVGSSVQGRLLQSENFKATLKEASISKTPQNFISEADNSLDKTARNAPTFPLKDEVRTSCCSVEPWTYHMKTNFSSEPFPIIYKETERQMSIKSIPPFIDLMHIKEKHASPISTLSRGLGISSFPTKYSSHTIFEKMKQHKMENKSEMSISCPVIPQLYHTCSRRIKGESPPMKENLYSSTCISKLPQSRPQEKSPDKDYLGIKHDVENALDSTDLCVDAAHNRLKGIDFVQGGRNEEVSKASSPRKVANQCLDTASNVPAFRLLRRGNHLTHHMIETPLCVSRGIQTECSLLLKPTERFVYDKTENPLNSGDEITESIEVGKTKSVQVPKTVPAEELEFLVIHEQIKASGEVISKRGGCINEVCYDIPTSVYVKSESMDVSSTCAKTYGIHRGIDEQKQKNRQTNESRLNSCLRDKRSKSTRRKTIDQFVSVTNAVEIDINSLQQVKHESSETRRHIEGVKSNQPPRSYRLGNLAMDDSSRCAEGQKHVYECKEITTGDTNHAKRLSRCVKWVEQNYPFICERERKKEEKHIHMGNKLSKANPFSRKDKSNDFCDSFFFYHLKSSLHTNPYAQELFARPCKKDAINTSRTDRRSYTIFWLLEHNMLRNASKKFYSVECKRKKIPVGTVDLKAKTNSISVNIEGQSISQLFPKDRYKDHNSFKKDLQHLDQNFNKKPKNKKDKKGKNKKDKKSKNKKGEASPKKNKEKDKGKQKASKSGKEDKKKGKGKSGSKDRVKKGSSSKGKRNKTNKTKRKSSFQAKRKSAKKGGSFQVKQTSRQIERELEEVEPTRQKDEKYERRRALMAKGAKSEDVIKRPKTKRRRERPRILRLFGIKKRRQRDDRWAEFRPKDDRTLQEDLALLKATIGEATPDQVHEEEDVEVPLIFVYIGMCLFIMLGGLINVRINPDIGTMYESIYFVYVLCSTIGFGDFLPCEDYYWFHLIYALTGVSMFNITVNATLQYMMATLDYLKVVVRKP